jgi:hypothetical protein
VGNISSPPYFLAYLGTSARRDNHAGDAPIGTSAIRDNDASYAPIYCVYNYVSFAMEYL